MRAISAVLLGLSFTIAGCGDSTDDSSNPLPVTSGAGGGDATSSTSTNTSSTGDTTTTTTTASTTATASSSVTGGPCDGGGPTVETAGSKTKVLLKGTVLTPGGPLEGQVLIDGQMITCVAADCTAMAAGATVVATAGVIAPGLIDTHNHILFDTFDETDWSPTMSYTNHNQWPNDDKYGAMVDAKQYMSGEDTGSPLELACEMLKYGELKALIAGTTSVLGSPGAANRRCYGSIARTIDLTYNDLPADNMQTATIFPSTSTANGVCTNFDDLDTTAYVIHIAEGVDQSALDEFADLGTITTTDGCLYDSRTTIVHGTALGDPELSLMGAEGMSLAWSPRSNVFLYGAGADLTKTTNIPLALSKGINVALGPDWSIGGSINMLDEMRYANGVDDAIWSNILTPRDIVDMATINGAEALALEEYIGAIEINRRADIAVFFREPGMDPYEAVLAATPKEVTMVFIDGRMLYGDAAIGSLGPDNSTCEAIDLCCRAKTACITENDGMPADRLDQTIPEISQALEQGIASYDALNVSQWDFAPIAPLFKCN